MKIVHMIEMAADLKICEHEMEQGVIKTPEYDSDYCVCSVSNSNRKQWRFNDKEKHVVERVWYALHQYTDHFKLDRESILKTRRTNESRGRS